MLTVAVSVSSFATMSALTVRCAACGFTSTGTVYPDNTGAWDCEICDNAYKGMGIVITIPSPPEAEG